MPCQLPSDEITYVSEEMFSHMCNLAMEKCSRKAEKKKASCGGAAMRKRLLIKNFVSQMLAQDRSSRSECSTTTDDSVDESSTEKSFTSTSSLSSFTDDNDEKMEEEEDEVQDENDDDDDDDEQEQENSDDLNTSAIIESDEEDEEEEEDDERKIGKEQERELVGEQQLAEDEAAVASILVANKANNHQLFNSTMAEGSPYNLQNKEIVAEEEEDEGIGHSEPDDDFHKVPLPNTVAGVMETIFDDDTLHGGAPDVWRFLKPSNGNFHDDNNFVEGDHFAENILSESAADKLYFMKSSEIDGAEHQPQLVGLVNMMPFGDESDDGFMRFGQPASAASPQILTNLDCFADINNGGTTRKHSQKRPWSMMLVDEEQHFGAATTPSSASFDSSALLSPLCCGMFQMSPFGGGEEIGGENAFGGGTLPPMIKRVKL